MSTNDGRPSRARVEIYDTTLRDGSQLEGISLTVDDKLRIAEQLDWLGVDYIEAGWPGANPKDDELFRRRRSRAAARDEQARRVRDDPAGEGQGRLRRHVAPPGRRQHRHGVHRRQVLGLPRARSARHHARRGRGDGRRLDRVPEGPGREVLFDAEHFFDGFGATPSSACACSRARCRRRRPAGAVRHQRRERCRTRSRGPVREVVKYFGADVAIGVHLHDDTGCGVANAVPH